MSQRNSEAVFNLGGVIRKGNATVKEDGFASFWKQKWLVLSEQQLSMHKSEVGAVHRRLRRWHR